MHQPEQTIWSFGRILNATVHVLMPDELAHFPKRNMGTRRTALGSFQAFAAFETDVSV